MYSDPLGKCRPEHRDHHRETKHATRPTGVRLNKRQASMHDRTTDGQHQCDVSQGQPDRQSDRKMSLCACSRPHHSQQHGEYDPPDQVIKYGGGNYCHAKFAAIKIQIHQRLGNYWQGRNRQRGR